MRFSETSRFTTATIVTSKFRLESPFITDEALTNALGLAVFSRGASHTCLWTNLPLFALEGAELTLCTSIAALLGLARPLRAQLAVIAAFLRLVFSSSAIDGFKNCRWAAMPCRTNNAGLAFTQLVPPVIAHFTG